MSLAPIGGGRTLTSPDAVPARRPAERLEEIARELMTVTAMLRSAELRSELCSSDKVERAKLAVAGATPEAQQALRAACEPATLVELGECIETLIHSISQGVDWQRIADCGRTTRRRSKTCRDPFAASSMTAQSRCSSTSLPAWMAHNRPAPPGCARGRARRHPNRLAAFQPNSAARPAQFSPPVKKLLQSLKNWRHRCGGMSVCGRWWSRRAIPSIQLEGMRRVRRSAGTSSGSRASA
jgi:hypothetical protein